MTPRKAFLTGTLSLALLSTAACGLVEKAAAPITSAAAASPRETLLDAVPDEKVGAYRFDIKGGVTPMSGVLDAPRKAVDMKLVEKIPDAGLTMTMSLRVVDKQSWIRFVFSKTLPGLPKLPKKWSKLDPGRLEDQKDSPLQYGDETDPGSTSLLVQSASDLQEISAGHFAGTVDLTQATDAEIVEEKTLTALGEKAKAVPFTAVIGAEGHLTSAVVKVPAAGSVKASTYQVTYSGFGKTEGPAEPAADQQIPAPAAIYELLNG